jgi:hypothetical protein
MHASGVSCPWRFRSSTSICAASSAFRPIILNAVPAVRAYGLKLVASAAATKTASQQLAATPQDRGAAR